MIIHSYVSTIIYTRVLSHLARSDNPNITWVVSHLARSDNPNITWVVSHLARSDNPNITWVVSHLARSDNPNITWVVSHLARSDNPNITWVVWRLARSDTPNTVVTPCAPADQSWGSARVHSSWAQHSLWACKCICTRSVKSGHNLKTMNAKNTTKSSIHENADTNITCDFGDGDISRYRRRFPHTRTATSLARL